MAYRQRYCGHTSSMLREMETKNYLDHLDFLSVVHCFWSTYLLLCPGTAIINRLLPFSGLVQFCHKEQKTKKKLTPYFDHMRRLASTASFPIFLRNSMTSEPVISHPNRHPIFKIFRGVLKSEYDFQEKSSVLQLRYLRVKLISPCCRDRSKFTLPHYQNPVYRSTLSTRITSGGFYYNIQTRVSNHGY